MQQKTNRTSEEDSYGPVRMSVKDAWDILNTDVLFRRIGKDGDFPKPICVVYCSGLGTTYV